MKKIILVLAILFSTAQAAEAKQCVFTEKGVAFFDWKRGWVYLFDYQVLELDCRPKYGMFFTWGGGTVCKGGKARMARPVNRTCRIRRIRSW